MSALNLPAEFFGPRCVVCDDPDGSVEWIHKSCHRLLHHRFEPKRSELRRLRKLDRHALIPC